MDKKKLGIFEEYNKNKKSICFIAASGISIRNIMLPSSLEGLLKLNKKYNIIFITNIKFFKSYKTNFRIIPLIDKRNFLDVILHVISRFLFDKIHFTNTKKIRYKNNLKKKSYSTYIFNKIFFLIPKNRFLYKVIRKLHNKITKLSRREIRKQLKNYNVKQIISLNSLSKAEYPYILIGNDICESYCVVRSFDNITKDGYMPFVPKNIFVWNKKMKKEALEHYQEYKPNIYIVGSPQYDNLKLKKKIDKVKSNQVLYCSNSPHLYPDDPDNIIFLKKYAKKFKFQILLRIHQADDIRRWQKIEEDEYLKFYPDKTTHKDPNLNVADINHQKSLAEQIKSSFVVICSYSTITYDSLSLGVPFINLGYDFFCKSFHESVTRLEEYEHIKPFIKLKCCDNVRSKKELVNRILFRRKKGFSRLENESRVNYLKESLSPNIGETWINNVINYLEK